MDHISGKSATIVERIALGEGIAVDFEIKLVAPKANLAPALRIEVGGEGSDVPLNTRDGKLWHGGIVASARTELLVSAVSRINKGGSMSMSIKEPGFAWGPAKVEPVDGVCSLGPFSYTVG